jgi:PHD-finger
MSHKHTRESIKKSESSLHKAIKFLTLYKYKIARKPEFESTWGSKKSPVVHCAYDYSALPKTIKAYLQAGKGSKKSSRTVPEKLVSQLDLPISSESFDTESYCNCNKPYSQGELMFKCEGFCGNWYHPECLKMKNEEIKRQENSNMRWYCPKCVNKAVEVMIECYDYIPSKTRIASIG